MWTPYSALLIVVVAGDKKRSTNDAKYFYQYNVKDDGYGVEYGADEQRQGENIFGSYNVRLPYGSIQKVVYTVQGQEGAVYNNGVPGNTAPQAYPQLAATYNHQPVAAYHQPVASSSANYAPPIVTALQYPTPGRNNPLHFPTPAAYHPLDLGLQLQQQPQHYSLGSSIYQPQVYNYLGARPYQSQTVAPVYKAAGLPHSPAYNTFTAFRGQNQARSYGTNSTTKDADSDNEDLSEEVDTDNTEDAATTDENSDDEKLEKLEIINSTDTSTEASTTVIEIGTEATNFTLVDSDGTSEDVNESSTARNETLDITASGNVATNETLDITASGNVATNETSEITASTDVVILSDTTDDLPPTDQTDESASLVIDQTESASLVQSDYSPPQEKTAETEELDSSEELQSVEESESAPLVQSGYTPPEEKTADTEDATEEAQTVAKSAPLIVPQVQTNELIDLSTSEQIQRISILSETAPLVEPNYSAPPAPKSDEEDSQPEKLTIDPENPTEPKFENLETYSTESSVAEVVNLRNGGQTSNLASSSGNELNVSAPSDVETSDDSSQADTAPLISSEYPTSEEQASERKELDTSEKLTSADDESESAPLIESDYAPPANQTAELTELITSEDIQPLDDQSQSAPLIAPNEEQTNAITDLSTSEQIQSISILSETAPLVESNYSAPPAPKNDEEDNQPEKLTIDPENQTEPKSENLESYTTESSIADEVNLRNAGQASELVLPGNVSAISNDLNETESTGRGTSTTIKSVATTEVQSTTISSPSELSISTTIGPLDSLPRQPKNLDDEQEESKQDTINTYDTPTVYKPAKIESYPVKSSYDSYESPKAPIKSSYDSYGSPKAPIKSSHDSYGSPKAPVKSSHDSYGSPKAPVQSSHDSYGSPEAPVKPTYNSYVSPEAPIKSTYTSYEPAQIPIQSSYTSYEPTNAPYQSTYNSYKPTKSPYTTYKTSYASPHTTYSSYSTTHAPYHTTKAAYQAPYQTTEASYQDAYHTDYAPYKTTHAPYHNTYHSHPQYSKKAPKRHRQKSKKGPFPHFPNLRLPKLPFGK